MSPFRNDGGVTVERCPGGLRLRGSAADGAPLDVTLEGVGAGTLDLHELLAAQNVDLKTPLEELVLAVEGANSTGDFHCLTLPGGGHAHHYAGPEGSPTLVMLHALGGNNLTWLPLVELLRGRAHLYCLDLPGHGRTPALAGGLNARSVAGWVGRQLAELEQGAVHLVGHSLGGRAAAVYASASPDRVRSLTLLAPALRPSRHARARAAMWAGMGLVRLAHPTVRRHLARSLLRGMLVRRDRVNQIFLDYALADLLRDQARVGYAGIRGGLEWLAREPIEDVDWARLTSSVTVRALFGEGDVFCSPAGHGYLAHVGVKLDVVPRGGHLLPLEDPARCVSAIVDSCGLGGRPVAPEVSGPGPGGDQSVRGAGPSGRTPGSTAPG